MPLHSHAIALASRHGQGTLRASAGLLRKRAVLSTSLLRSTNLYHQRQTPSILRISRHSTMATQPKTQPPWTSPAPASASSDTPKLQIYNSLTRSKNEFFPIDVRGKKVTWYCCGPTVYDAGHLGHARNYVTSDILRRIMRDYFGYEVVFVQNVTDVDDKVGRLEGIGARRAGADADRSSSGRDKASCWTSSRRSIRR